MKASEAWYAESMEMVNHLIHAQTMSKVELLIQPEWTRSVTEKEVRRAMSTFPGKLSSKSSWCNGSSGFNGFTLSGTFQLKRAQFSQMTANSPPKYSEQKTTTLN